MSHARLTPGMENSGKLVTFVRQNASKIAKEQRRGLVLVDGSPGIGCPVIASIANIDASVVVVEPTLSGIHDLKRAIELLDHFEVTPYVVVNKYDLNIENTFKIDEYCQKNEIADLGFIPFDSEVSKSIVAGKPIVIFKPDSPAAKAIKRIWENLMALILA
jgi:MinD superfamily P-loop ATPase